MFSYYGSKSKLVHLYPAPRYGRIIEPFAGSARYALKYFDRDVLLVDKYEVIVRIWQYLQKCSAKDILSMPSPKPRETINRKDFDCIEQAWLMGFLIQAGVDGPRLTATEMGTKNLMKSKKFIAANLYKIRHWEIRHGSYEEISNQDATWFIDPPYQFGGEYYRLGNKHIDYGTLANWCRSRHGQVIVCENTKATWMAFYPLRRIQGTIHKSTEAIWCNHAHDFQARQQNLFEMPNV